jgi:hypothetical protein
VTRLTARSIGGSLTCRLSDTGEQICTLKMAGLRSSSRLGPHREGRRPARAGAGHQVPAGLVVRIAGDEGAGGSRIGQGNDLPSPAPAGTGS